MSNSNFFFFLFFIWTPFNSLVLSYSCLQTNNYNPQFNQRIHHFWEFDEQSNAWVQLKLPYDLLSCVNNNCTKVGSIDQTMDIERESDVNSKKKKSSVSALTLRKRVSLIKMSETSIWVTGESGSIYERFWNGVKWVIAPHHLPLSAGYAVSVFIINHTILALSEAGFLYQMQVNENSQPVWVEFGPPQEDGVSRKETEPQVSAVSSIKSGVISQDRQRIYFSTMDGMLLELDGIEPPRWINHGRPPGANVAGIVDVASIRPHLIFTVSSTGDLYEYDKSTKPSWKKHIWGEGSSTSAELKPYSMGFTVPGITGPHSVSLFLLNQGGNLVERRLNQRKWKWVVHGSPKDHHLTSITPFLSQDEFFDDKSASLFLTTESGFVFQYQIPIHLGITGVDGEENKIPKEKWWVNHMHPPHAKVAKGIKGLQFQVGRFIFPLDDGRLGELHLSGFGGETVGPTQHHLNTSRRRRKKSSLKYIWSVLDAPETEGWNARYCTEEYGSSNCILGVKDQSNDADTTRSTPSRRKGTKTQQVYLLPTSSGSGSRSTDEYYNLADNGIEKSFRLRVMYEERSFFLITESGLTFEYLNAENVWLWLRHDHSTAMKGALGNYNGSLFLVDENMNLLIRERSNNELAWINCTAVRNGRHVIAGSPWDGVPGRAPKLTPDDALFFLSKNGRLLQLTVALRKFTWKDCRNPPNTKIVSIIDQEVFRENIVFVVGQNGRLYQYNKVTHLWHEHYQSQHMVLSKFPGAAMRPSTVSLTGSLFMLSEDSKLVEYHWDSLEGWDWVEHGTPYVGVALVGTPGPCFGGNQLFLIGSNGKVYMRYLDQQGAWEWADCGFPYSKSDVEAGAKKHGTREQVCPGEDYSAKFEELDENIHDSNKNCNPKVASTRPIPFAEDTVIFELRDGRLGEMRRREEDGSWVWSRIIGTPTSLCTENYWTALAS